MQMYMYSFISPLPAPVFVFTVALFYIVTLKLEHPRREVGINNYSIMCLSCSIQCAIIFKLNVTNVCMCIW